MLYLKQIKAGSEVLTPQQLRRVPLPPLGSQIDSYKAEQGSTGQPVRTSTKHEADNQEMCVTFSTRSYEQSDKKKKKMQKAFSSKSQKIDYKNTENVLLCQISRMSFIC